MKSKSYLIFLLLGITVLSHARVVGTVYDDKGYPLVGANVYWAGTTVGVATDLDGKFSLEACRCIGACGLAPVFTINGEVYGKVTADDIPGILAKYMD